MREIALDTETTGFKPEEGHRLVEIGCVEIINQLPTENKFHQYINPCRDMPDEAFRVHGLSEEYLKDFPKFEEIAQSFIDFIGDSPLVIHNAAFDMTFLNFELNQFGFKKIPLEQAIDTLIMARTKFPGSPANLDALCRRFDIDNTDRTLHGALLDAELLSEVYLELLGGRQRGLSLSADDGSDDVDISILKSEIKHHYNLEKRSFPVNDAELELHKKMLENLKDPLWNKS